MWLAEPIALPTLCKRHAYLCRRCHKTQCFTALTSPAIRLLVATVKWGGNEVVQAERNQDAETDELKKINIGAQQQTGEGGYEMVA